MDVSHRKRMIFKIFYLFIFREREGREKEREKHHCVVATHAPPTRDLAHNPGMCPDWESNRRPFGSQAGSQSTEPPQPGPFIFFLPSNSYIPNALFTACVFKKFNIIFQRLFQIITALEPAKVIPYQQVHIYTLFNRCTGLHCVDKSLFYFTFLMDI